MLLFTNYQSIMYPSVSNHDALDAQRVKPVHAKLMSLYARENYLLIVISGKSRC